MALVLLLPPLSWEVLPSTVAAEAVKVDVTMLLRPTSQVKLVVPLAHTRLEAVGPLELMGPLRPLVQPVRLVIPPRVVLAVAVEELLSRLLLPELPEGQVELKVVVAEAAELA